MYLFLFFLPSSPAPLFMPLAKALLRAAAAAAKLAAASMAAGCW
jgi:hypothetical protein